MSIFNIFKRKKNDDKPSLKDLANELNKSIVELDEAKKNGLVEEPSTPKEPKKISGSFDITGWKYLPPEVKKAIRYELQEGDDVQLIPDPTNEYDKFAIKVMWKNMQLGWYGRKGYRKNEVHKRILNGNEYTCKIKEIYRGKNNAYILLYGKYTVDA